MKELKAKPLYTYSSFFFFAHFIEQLYTNHTEHITGENIVFLKYIMDSSILSYFYNNFTFLLTLKIYFNTFQFFSN